MSDADAERGFVHRHIEIGPYDPRWPGYFEREAARVRAALGARALRIDHVGSTSVPGLASKPRIDIQVSVASFEPEDPLIEPLLAIGFTRQRDLESPDHRFLFTWAGGRGYGVNIHICEAGSDWEWRHLAFRNALRADPTIAQAYEAEKGRLAAIHANDAAAYAGAKSRFIRPVEWKLRGPDPAEVVIVDADPAWPAVYEKEAERIMAMMADVIVSIEHIGSTAVPGLAAAPVIDIMVSVRSFEPIDAYKIDLEELGYEYLPGDDPSRRAFKLNQPGVRIANLDVREVGSEWGQRDIAFRDLLRADPELAAAYVDLKRTLAARFPDDVAAYTEAKAGFIVDALDRTGWAGIQPAR